jgi:FKBP-type peptidyl-prolyl cis-trans isomerase
MRLLKLSFLLLLALSITNCGKDCDSDPNLDVNEEQLQADIAAIDAYLNENGIEAEEHPTGIRYVIKRKGDGDSPSLCDNIAVTYEGRLISNGNVFDSSQNIRSFPLNGVITGWQVGVPLIKEGGRITLFIPSVYGYGATGSSSGSIPPNANLQFEVVLFGIQ